jgi:hypothetical protein
MEILRLSGPALNHAREELISEALVSYKRPYWEVTNIPQRRDHGRDHKADDPLSSGGPKTELLPDPRPNRDVAKACLAHISRMLSGQEGKEGLYSERIPPSDCGVVQRASDLKSPAGPRVVKNEGSKD